MNSYLRRWEPEWPNPHFLHTVGWGTLVVSASFNSRQFKLTTSGSQLHGARGSRFNCVLRQWAWRQLCRKDDNAQTLPAHRPAADDNTLSGCTSHDLTDDWSHLCPFRWQPMPCLFRCEVSSVLLSNHTAPIYLSNLPLKLGLGLGLDLKWHYFSIFHGK